MPTTDKSLRRAIRKANQATNPTPSPKQVQARNYRMGKLHLKGLDIAIETPADGVRAGVNKETGKEWSITLSEPYGEIRKIDGKVAPESEADGDLMDVFIGDHPESEIAFVVDQNNPAGEWDEHKIVLGCTNQEDAIELYHRNYSEGWAGFRSITALTLEQLKNWIREGNTADPLKGQPFDFHKAASDEEFIKMASFMKLLSGGLRTLAGTGGTPFRAAPIGNAARVLFRPSFGRYTKPVRMGAMAGGAGILSSTAYSMFDTARNELKAIGLAAGLAGQAVPALARDPQAKQDWAGAMQLVQGIADNPMWAFRPTAHPAYSTLTPGAQQATSQFIDQARRHVFNTTLERTAQPHIGAADAFGAVSGPLVPPLKKALMSVLGHFKLPVQKSLPQETWDLTQALSHTKGSSAEPESEDMTKVAIVKQVGDEWLLYTKDGKRILGRHKTPGGAYGQEYAIQKSQERKMEKAAGRAKFPDMPDCVGVDLDGTLAHHDPDKEFDPDHIGDPLPERLAQVKEWLDAGIEVRIFTARAAESRNIPVIEAWLEQHGLDGLQITNRKTPDMGAIIDDRAHHAPANQDEEFVVKAAAQQPRYLYHMLPAEAVESVKKHGLLSSHELAKNPEALALARPDPKERADWLEFLKKQENWDHRKGPNLLFSQIPENVALNAQHPTKQNKLQYVRVLVDKLRQDIPDAKFYGLELQPFDSTIGAIPEDQWDKLPQEEQNRHIEKRKHYLDETELDDLMSRAPEELWKNYQGEDGKYAPNVPHVSLITPDGRIDPKYLEFADTIKQAATIPAEIPTTGPAAILHALQNMDMGVLEQKARQDLKGGSVQKRDKAVRLLGILDGLKRNKAQPHELMITKVPVIPAAFRPFTTIGEVLVPGDANLLYQDVFRFRDAYRDANQTFGPEGAGDARLALYDAVKAVYGFGDAVNPKTKARGVQGFMRQIAGSNPKHGFFQRKLISKPMDSVSRGVIVPDPELDMDQIGIPHDMAWTMYGSHVMGRMVRTGTTEPLALKAVKDRTPDALQALQQEIAERPVLYSRAPAWHKFNSVAGFPVLVDGDAIRISNMTASGLNADYDGDQCINQIYACIPHQTALKLRMSFHNLDFHIIRLPSNSGIPALIGHDIYVFDLADFPHGEKERTTLGANGPIDFHSVPEGIKVLAYDEMSGGLNWADVACWSLHYQREIEVVDTHNGFQIVTDDDPRAVYGTAAGELHMRRFTPSDALSARALIPRARTVPEPLVTTHTIAGITGAANAIPMPAVIPLTARVGWLLGAVCGDGWVIKSGDVAKGFALADNDGFNIAKLRTVLADITLDRLPAEQSVSSDGSEDGRHGATTSYRFSSGLIGQWLRGLVGGERDATTAGSANKHLPVFYLTAPRDFRLGLLAGLMDTDGSIAVSGGKAKPQLMANFSSTSIRLAMEVKLLAGSLGIAGRLTPGETPLGKACWQVSFSAMDIQKWDGMHMAHTDKLRKLRSVALIGTSPVTAKYDIVPISTACAAALAGKIGCPKLKKAQRKAGGNAVDKIRETQSLYMTLVQAKMPTHPKFGAISRQQLQVIVDRIGRANVLTAPDGEAVLRVLDNADVTWERVIGVQKTGIHEDGYDLTVPGYETFMAADGIILSNTLNIHVPALPKSVKEARDRLLPSKMLFSIKDPDKTVPVPKHEMIWGTFAANNRNTGMVHRFGSRDLALKAVESGQLDPADEVEFPD